MRSLPYHFTEDSFEHFLRVCWGSSTRNIRLSSRNIRSIWGRNLRRFMLQFDRTHAAKLLEQNNSTSYLVVFLLFDIFLHFFSIFFSLLWKALSEAMRSSSLSLTLCFMLKACHIVSSCTVHSTVLQKWVCGSFYSRGNRNFARTWLMSRS